MDQLTLKPRKAVVQEEIENWDDDDLDIGGDDFAFRSASLATTASSLGHHRDSISSRLSGRSFDSNNGDEDRQVHVPGDDERSTLDAIATAARAGIPIPHNVPSSALMGGTIKRLGGRKIKKIIQDDWDDGDLELPGEGGLKIKRQDGANFPDALRQVSGPGSSQASPVKHLQPAPKFNPSPQKLKSKAAAANLLDQFRDDDDDDFLGDGEATIKVAKSRAPNKLIPLITPPTPLQNPKSTAGDDSFENDLQFPTEGGPLKLTARKDIPQTPVNQQENFDEWGEGSLGTRFGGTRRDGRHSNRSSSIPALSPSVSSSLTVESEDEGLDGLVLPTGPLNFDDILKRRQEDRSPELETREKRPSKLVEVKDDFLQDLDIGDGDVFDSKKLTLNRNVKIKTVRQTSPTRPKTAVSLTFTNKPPTSLAGSRLPRPLGHERVPSQLAPVSETGGPIASRQRRSQSRMGHSAQSSISSVGTPTTPYSNHSFQPATPRRRDIAPKPSLNALRNEPTTTSAQLLKLKRSLPGLRSHPQSPAKPMTSRYERPPSRTESGSRAMSRPKTPVERDRSGAESSMSHLRRNPLPFLAGGSSTAQSHHVAIKTTSSRHFRRHDSESSTNSTELRPSSRTVSRSTMRSPSPKRQVNRGAEALAREAASKRTITKPVRRRHFGDGFELDGFDDLPTSKDSEQRFIKEPVGRGPPKQSSLRNKFPPEFAHLRTQTPAPFSPVRTRDELPRFARDTNASRMAREQTISQRTPSSGAPLSTMTNQWKSKVNATTGLSAVHAQSVKPKKSKGRLQQPQLIKPLGSLNNPKSIKGMYYNPHTYKWEGNENDMDSFDAPASSPSISSASVPSHMIREKDHPAAYREKENTTPRPALITNVNSSQNVQVVGGMVFDPQRMCWLKMPSSATRSKSGKSEGGDTMDGFDAFDDDEDVFKDVPDLEDERKSDSVGGRKSDGASGLKDDWLVGEEFDVGPEFVRRQQEEEERWRRKCEKWVGAGRDLEAGGDIDWRWSIREVVG